MQMICWHKLLIYVRLDDLTLDNCCSRYSNNLDLAKKILSNLIEKSISYMTPDMIFMKFTFSYDLLLIKITTTTK